MRCYSYLPTWKVWEPTGHMVQSHDHILNDLRKWWLKTLFQTEIILPPLCYSGWWPSFCVSGVSWGIQPLIGPSIMSFFDSSHLHTVELCREPRGPIKAPVNPIKSSFLHACLHTSLLEDMRCWSLLSRHDNGPRGWVKRTSVCVLLDDLHQS